MKITGKQFVKAIIAILKEKNTSGVSFDPKSYDLNLSKNELPWCIKFDSMIDTISAPCMWSEDITNSDWTNADKKRAQEKHFPDCICICVENGGQILYDFFDGTENEDFDHLFHDVYDELWDGGINDDEGDIWLDRFIGGQNNNDNA